MIGSFVRKQRLFCGLRQLHFYLSHELLESGVLDWQGIAKAGVCARADAHKVGRDFDIELQGIEELTDHPVVRADETIVSRSLASESVCIITKEKACKPGNCLVFLIICYKLPCLPDFRIKWPTQAGKIKLLRLQRKSLL